jgi:hypothetical protein
MVLPIANRTAVAITVRSDSMAPSVTCDMPFRLENSDKGDFGCDTVEISAPKSRFGPFFYSYFSFIC